MGCMGGIFLWIRAVLNYMFIVDTTGCLLIRKTEMKGLNRVDYRVDN